MSHTAWHTIPSEAAGLQFDRSVDSAGSICRLAEQPTTVIELNHAAKIMQITKITKGDTWELMVPGRIDGAVANQLEIDILAAIKAGAREIFINLSQAEWMCSAGIRVLLQYYRQMKNNRKVLLVTRPSAAISEILEMTGFKDIIEGAGPDKA